MAVLSMSKHEFLPARIRDVQVEPTLPDGTKLVTVPLGARAAQPGSHPSETLIYLAVCFSPDCVYLIVTIGIRRHEDVVGTGLAWASDGRETRALPPCR
jgi:hypothetical protein